MTSEWQWLTLSDVLVPQRNRKPLQQGWSPRCHPHPAESGNWGVLKTTAVQAGSYEPTHNKGLPEALEPRPQFEVRAGDLLMTCAGPRARCGVPTLVRQTPERLMMSGKMYRFRPDERLDPRFLELWLLSAPAQKRIDAMKTGISDSGLNLTHDRFVQLPVPVPSLDEQQRIVGLLEDHQSRLDAADSYLTTAGARGAVLYGQLLAAALAGVEADEARLSDLLAVGLANGRSVPTQHDGFPVLRLTALRNGRIDLSERKGGAWTQDDAARFLIERDDFLISRGNGSLHLVGLGGLVVDDPDPVAYPDTMIRARPNVERLTAVYLAMVWNSPLVRRQIEAVARTTAGIYKVNQRDLGSIAFPVPSLADQAAVVRKVQESRDSLAAVASVRMKAITRSHSLRRSLLTAAFSGRLTGDQPTKGLQ